MHYKNVLLGIGIGDAALFGIEFQSREWIKEHVDFSKYVTARSKYSRLGYKEGDYSDDCEMTVGSIRAILSPREMSQNLLIEMWRNEYDKSKMVRNGVPRAGHGSIGKYFEGKNPLKEIHQMQAKKYSPGNAPSMRAIPFGSVQENKINLYATMNANATHPHPKGIAASILIARAAQFIFHKDGDQQEVIKYALRFIQEQDTRNYLKQVDKLPPNSENYETLCGPQPIPWIKSEEIYGLPCDAMRTAGSALYIIKHATNTFDGLKRSARFGGDVDSLGAITVGILAGRHGLSSLPSFYLESLENKSELEKLANEFQSSNKITS